MQADPVEQALRTVQSLVGCCSFFIIALLWARFIQYAVYTVSKIKVPYWRAYGTSLIVSLASVFIPFVTLMLLSVLGVAMSGGDLSAPAQSEALESVMITIGSVVAAVAIFFTHSGIYAILLEVGFRKGMLVTLIVVGFQFLLVVSVVAAFWVGSFFVGL